MDWTAITGGSLAAVSLLNLLVSNKTRADVAEVKLHVVEKMVEQDKETREWAEREFAKKEVVEARFAALSVKAHR
jgi:hypothetical protein